MNNENRSTRVPWSRADALLSAAQFLGAWEKWVQEWGGSVQAEEPGPEDAPPFAYRMVDGALGRAHFDCEFNFWPMGRLGTGYADAELIVTSRTDGSTVTFAYEGATNTWVKTGDGLRGFSCAWPESARPEFPLPTIGGWMNILAHQTWCECGALLTNANGFVCTAPVHEKKAPAPPSEASPTPTQPPSYRQKLKRLLAAAIEHL